MNYIEIKQTDTEAIKELSKLASEIVKEHYDPILGGKQNDYMIAKYQSAKSISEQIDQDYKYFFVNDQSEIRVGFIAFYFRKNDLYLSKFYLLKKRRGYGIAKDMLNFIISQAEAVDLSSIVLNVNKYNDIAIRAYEKLGFNKIGEEKNEIGNGYYMDDYVCELLLN